MRFCQAPQPLEQLHGALPAISLCVHTALRTAFGDDILLNMRLLGKYMAILFITLCAQW